MKRTILILTWLLMSAVKISAQPADDPERSFLWNTFSSFREVDGYAIVTSDFGLAVLEYDPAAEQYRQVGQLLTATQPFTSKLSADVLAVQTWADIVYFVDVSDLPNLTFLGEADIAFPFYDFALYDQSLYIAAGFDGLLRYQLTDYSDPVLVDSNLSGVHNVQVDIYGDEMMVLDDYNATMRYDLSVPGFGAFLDHLWLPLQAASFARIDSTVIIPLNGRTRVFMGVYGVSGPAITDTVELVFEPDLAFAVDTHFVAVSTEANLMQTIGRQTHTGILVALPRSTSPYRDGCALSRAGENHLVLPDDNGGLWDFDLDNLLHNGLPREVYNRPGPIVDVYLDDGKLITGGRSNPFEVYTVPPVGWPTLDTTLYGLSDIGAIARVDSVYLAHYREANSVFVLQKVNGSIESIASINIGSSSASRDIKFYKTDLADTLDIMLVQTGRHIDVYGVDDSWVAQLVRTVEAADVILDAVVVDSFLVFASADDQLHGYKFGSNLHPFFWWAVSTPGPINHLTTTGPRTAPDSSPLEDILLGFSGSDMYRIEIPSTYPPIVVPVATYDLEIMTSAVFDNALYTVGDFGMGLLDLAYFPPPLVHQWGLPGNRIAVDSTGIAISDGTAIHLYPLVQTESSFLEPIEPAIPDGQLGQNYPNPFNPRTTIDYYLPEPTPVQISVLNVLGQTVATLVDRTVAAGRHTVAWDGVDDSGERVASGIYFYRLITPDKTETRKMVVLK